MINESESLQKKLDAINELLTSNRERENVDDFEYFQDQEQETKTMIDDVVQKDYIDKKSLYSSSRFIIDEIIKGEKSEYFQSKHMKAVRSTFFYICNTTEHSLDNIYADDNGAYCNSRTKKEIVYYDKDSLLF